MTKQWDISDQTKWPKFVYKITKSDYISDQKVSDVKLGIKKVAMRGTNDEAKHGIDMVEK